MSILISAPIRTGKTLYTMKLIFEYLNKGRQVYTNIVGIKVDGVISVASSINDPFDWRNLPNGSVLVWDEAHEHPAFSEQDLLKTFKIDNSMIPLTYKYKGTPILIYFLMEFLNNQELILEYFSKIYTTSNKKEN